MTGKTRAPVRAHGPAVRLARLLIGPNRLRRPPDRIEGLLVTLLTAAFLAVVAAAPYFGERLYQSQRAGSPGQADRLCNELGDGDEGSCR